MTNKHDDNCVSILIPAYNPSQELIDLVSELNEAKFDNIVIVNDGSSETDDVFNVLANNSTVAIISHEVNQGKGRALKTGFQYIRNNMPDCRGVITVDADGQHLTRDITSVAKTFIDKNHCESVVLGVRHFDERTPWRSKFGNKASRLLFRWYYKQDIEDTQTGLRAIPIDLLGRLIDIPYDGYEYEMQSLIELKYCDHPIKQVPITTVYIDDNSSSHFNPIFDSIRIYFVFFRYVIISLSSCVLDWLIFILMYHLTGALLTSLTVARLSSATFNFYHNKYNVHCSRHSDYIFKEAAQYTLLALSVLFISYVGIRALMYATYLPVIVIKIIVDVLLFMMNFIIQRFVIFNHQDKVDQH